MTIPDVTGHVELVGDADGDGIRDLVVERGGIRGQSERIDLVSTRSGEAIRTLWRCNEAHAMPASWTAGGERAGAFDLILGFPDDIDGAGRVIVIAGTTGEVRYELAGERGDRFGSSLALLVDGDGWSSGRFCVGAIQYDPKAAITERWVDGVKEADLRGYWQERMRLRSSSPGYVSARRIEDGAELWRVEGDVPGFGFGTFVRSAGDLDRDRAPDVLVESDLRCDEPIVVLSAANGRTLARIPHQCGGAGTVGDMDGDGLPDFFVDHQDGSFVGRLGSVAIESSSARKPLFSLRYPDMWDEYEVTVPMGDFDGDGVPDIALGAPNFNLLAIGDHEHVFGFGQLMALLPLRFAMLVESEPWCSFTWESGCAIVYSGRTHEAIFGVWAEPGTREGLGLEVVPLPDVNGDGARDILVADENTAYIFAGPGTR
jgi:hypothetical protein